MNDNEKIERPFDTIGMLDDLEEAANAYDYYLEENGLTATTQAIFKAGAKWQKGQMLKEAVEVEFYWDGDFLAIDLNMSELGYSEHDKVKIIIIKEDKED